MSRYYLLATAAVLACHGAPQPDVMPAEVAAAMERYQQSARTANADSMAAHFTADGSLLEPGIPLIHTRDSIRAFLASFPGATVDVATATPDTIEVYADRALLWGSYFERLSFPGQPISEQHGKFVAQWTREGDGVLRIRRMYRIPLTTATP